MMLFRAGYWRHFRVLASVAVPLIVVLASCGDDDALEARSAPSAELGEPLVTENPSATLPTTTLLPTNESTSPSVVSTSGAPGMSPVITALPTDGIADAIIQGLLVEADGCVYIDLVGNGRRVLVLPYGTTWDAATSSVVNADGTSVSVDQQVWAQGGESAELDGLVPYWLDEDQLANAQRCGTAAGVTTAVISGTLIPGSP